MRQKNKQKNIAIIGGGFSGLSTAVTLMKKAQKIKLKVEVTVFEQFPPTKGGAYNVNLPTDFLLNHPANFMGCINLGRDDSNEDFYSWIQEWKEKPLKVLNGQALQERYKNFDLKNPEEYLPRSLYGIYLTFRLEELLKNSSSEYYSFYYRQDRVESIQKQDKEFIIYTGRSIYDFDAVVLCTGSEYPTEGDVNLIYAQNIYTRLPSMNVLKGKSVGILGSSLSGIELALALIKKGMTNVTLYSRNGRLPKVKGPTTVYELKFITPINVDAIKDNKGFLRFFSLIQLLKKEFDYDYSSRERGLYQKNGINWKRILDNRNPIEQFKKDVKDAKSDREMVWRSVCLAIAKNKPLLFPFLSPKDEKEIFDKYSSLILSFAAPLPLPQAEKLLSYIENKRIQIQKNITDFSYTGNKWEITIWNKKKMSVDYLIDARGPSKDVSENPLVNSLIQEKLVEKSDVYGLAINANFQSVVNYFFYT